MRGSRTPAVIPSTPLGGAPRLDRRLGRPLRSPTRFSVRRGKALHHLELDVGGGWQRGDIVRQRARERQQLVRLGARGHTQHVHLPGEEAAFERQVLGNHAPVNAGFDFDGLSRHRAGGGREREILGGVVSGVGAQQGDEIAESLDEGGPGIQAGSPLRGRDPDKLHHGA
jgi:hypothetical protein